MFILCKNTKLINEIINFRMAKPRSMQNYGKYREFKGEIY